MLRTTTLLLTAALVAGCGGNGEVGEACDTPGETEGECADGAICDATSDDGDVICMEICEDQADCSDGFSCNGVSSSNIKACHPDGDGDGDDGIDIDGDGDDGDGKNK